jgi:WD40 repeat protein
LLVGSPELLKLRQLVDWIEKEIQTFLVHNRTDPKVILADFGDVVADALAGLSPTGAADHPILKQLSPFLRLSQPLANLGLLPSGEVLAAIRQKLDGRRRDRTRLWFFEAVSGVLALLLILAILLGVAAEWERRDAVRQREKASITQSRFLADLSQQLTNSGDGVSGILVGPEGLPDEGRDFARPYVPQAEVALYHGLHARHETHVFHYDAFDADDAKFNPATVQIAPACSDGFIRILDAETLNPVTKLQQLDDLSWGGTRSASLNFVMYTTGFSDDGQFFVASSLDKTVRIWNAITWTLIDTVRGFESHGLPPGFPTHRRLLLLRGIDAHVYDLSRKTVISRISWKGDANRSAFLSPDGKWIVTSAFGEGISVFDADNGGDPILQFQMPFARNPYDSGLNFSPDGQFAVTIGESGAPELWNTHPWQLIRTLPGAKDAVRLALFSANGMRILTAHIFDRVARIWDGRTGAPVAMLDEHPEAIDLGVFSPDGSLVATATASDPTVRLSDARTGHLLRLLRGHVSEITSIRFIKDGTQLFAASKDGAVRVWDVANGGEILLLKGHETPPYNVDYLIDHLDVNPDGKQIITSSNFDKTVRLWSEAQGDSRGLLGPKYRVASVDFNSDGSHIAIASLENIVRIYDRQSGDLKKELATSLTASRARFSPDGTLLITDGSKVEFVNISTNPVTVPAFTAHNNGITGVTFSPGGKLIATSSSDGTWALWDKTSSKPILRLRGHGFNEKGELNWINSIEFRREACHYGWHGQFSSIWDVVSGKPLLALKGHGNWISSAVFSPDDKYVLTGSFDQTAKLWDSLTGAELKTFRGHARIVTKAIFTDAGTRIVTASGDNTARVWDVKTGDVIAVLTGHHGAIGDVTSTRDGSFIATASDDTTARLWRLLPTTKDAVDYARRAATRCLAPMQRQRYFLLPDSPGWCMGDAEMDLPHRPEERRTLLSAASPPRTRRNAPETTRTSSAV